MAKKTKKTAETKSRKCPKCHCGDVVADRPPVNSKRDTVSYEHCVCRGCNYQFMSASRT